MIHLFTKPFNLVDLASISDQTLKRAAKDKIRGIALLMTLKHVFNKDLQSFFEQTLVDILRRLDQVGDMDGVVDIIYYLLNEGEFRDEQRFWLTLHQNFSRELEGRIMTIAQKIRKEGIEKGIEKGIEQTAKRLLCEKTSFSDTELVEWVHRMTGLSIEKIKKLQKQH